MVHVGRSLDPHADLTPGVKPPLLGTVTRRPADRTAAAFRLPVFDRSPGQFPSLVSLLAEAVIEFIELGQPIGVGLLFGQFTQAVEPRKAMTILSLDPHHFYVLRVPYVFRGPIIRSAGDRPPTAT